MNNTEPKSLVASATPKLLLVDDRPEGLITLEAVLSGSRCELVKASSGLEALERVRADDFAVILLDVQMPELDGFETARRMKLIDRARDVPIIFITAINKDDQHVYKGYESGAVDYIFKPFDPHILRSKVAVLIDLQMKTATVKQQAQLLREAERRDRDRMLTQLELENVRRYRNLADAIPHIIIKTQPTGAPDHFNQVWFEYAGLSLSQSEGKGWLGVFEPSDLERFQARWRESMRTGAQFEIECRLKRGFDQAQRWHLIRGVAEKGAIGETFSWLITCTDIHDRKKTEEQNVVLFQNMQTALANLEERSKALELSNHDLEQFAYVASHDLQEPLRKVMSYTNLLHEHFRDSLTVDSTRYIQYVTEGVNRMHALIQGLLAYSRADKQGKAFEAVDTGSVLKSTIDTLQGLIKEHGARVTVDGLPVVFAEQTQLGQLFQNLICNALKFRNLHPPEIRVGAKRRGQEWIFFVEDNGIGIDPKHRDRIFIIFQRLHSQTKYPGSGIGLSICKKIVERHGGRIWVDSKPEGGSTFFFTLPVYKKAEEAVPA